MSNLKKIRNLLFGLIFLFTFCTYAVEIAIVDSLTCQRRDGSNLFDVGFNVSECNTSIKIFLKIITGFGDTIELQSFDSESKRIISTDGIKIISCDIQKDLDITEFSGYFDFLISYIPVNDKNKNQNHIYIANSRANTIIGIDDIFGSNYNVLDCSIFGGLYNANDIASDSAGRVYICDSYNYRVIRIDDITGVNSIILSKNSDNTDKLGELGSVAISPEGKIYVSDIENSRIVKVDDMSGSGWETYGKPGIGEGEFNHPIGISFDSLNRIYITDTYNNRIVRIDNMKGDNWKTLGSEGSGHMQFNKPTGVDIDVLDRIYVSDRKNNRVVRIEDIDGSGWESCYPGVKDTYAISVDSNYFIYLTDFLDNRIVRITDMDPRTVVYFTTGLHRPYGVHCFK